MTDTLATRIDRAVASLPRVYPGPGGAVAVLRDGETLIRHAWGYANAELRIPFTPRTLFRMCSITKQFTCALVLDALPDPSSLDAAIVASLPVLETVAPDALQLCHNQSGLRDYWAVSMLHGAPAESAFGAREAGRVIGGTSRLQFTPGTRYSYANQNFRLLCDVLEARTGRGFGELLRERIFDRVGMESAILAADTRAMPDGTEGYEGSQAAGFRRATNRILWTGDAGLGASLDDMIAWERHIDASRDDPSSLYARLCAPVAFADGAPAAYGFGLLRGREFGLAATGHGGALRGWRSHRIHLPSARLSVVVMFNHLSDAYAAALDVVAAVLGATRGMSGEAAAERFAPPDWVGAYIEPETGLSARIEAAATGGLRLRFGNLADMLTVRADGSATSDSVTLRVEHGALRMLRPREHLDTILRPCGDASMSDYAGRYVCDELGAELTVSDGGGVLYGGFSGFLGDGRMERLDPVAPGVWALPCPRALDHTPPGDWTLAFGPEGITVGCWLARGLRYRKVGA